MAAWRDRLRRLAIPAQVVSVGILGLSLAGWLGKWGLVFELISHFKVFYLLASAVCVLVLIGLRRWRWVGVAGVAVCLNAAAVMPWYFAGSLRDAGDARAGLKILQMNVNSANQRYEDFVSLARKEAPDVLALQEVNAAWVAALEGLRDLFPYKLAVPREDNFGIAVYSRQAFLRAKAVCPGRAGLPSILAALEKDGRIIHLLITHPVPPISRRCFDARNDQLMAVRKMVREINGPMVVLGDLNVTMWSPCYAEFMKGSGLHNARRGFGILPTWPAGLSLAKIPIDHCLLSSGLRAVRVRTGPNLGSDHLPLLVDVAVSPE